MKEGTDAFDNRSISMLGNTIMGRSIMYGELLFHPSLLQIQGESLVQVLPPLIGVKDLY